MFLTQKNKNLLHKGGNTNGKIKGKLFYFLVVSKYEYDEILMLSLSENHHQLGLHQ